MRVFIVISAYTWVITQTVYSSCLQKEEIFTKCNFTVNIQPVVNFIRYQFTVNDLETCMSFIQNFKVKNGIFCKSLSICGLDLDFPIRNIDHNWRDIAFNSTLNTCEVLVNSLHYNCEQLKDILVNEDVLKS